MDVVYLRRTRKPCETFALRTKACASQTIEMSARVNASAPIVSRHSPDTRTKTTFHIRPRAGAMDTFPTQGWHPPSMGCESPEEGLYRWSAALCGREVMTDFCYFFDPGMSAPSRVIHVRREGAEEGGGGLRTVGAGACGASALVPGPPSARSESLLGGGSLASFSAARASVGSTAECDAGGRLVLAGREPVSTHCTISDIRRLDGSSGLDGTRSIWSA